MIRLTAACLGLGAWLATGAFALAGDLPCAAEGSLRSKHSEVPTKMTFVNRTSQGRAIVWIDFNGGTKQYAWLDAGQRFSVDTFMTHPWLITDGPGNCIEIYLPRKGKRTVNLTRQPSFGDE